ncbi:hypothetical protein AAKU67_004087 [Oxalobacteraceae bacterium GrIS 2.11]
MACKKYGSLKIVDPGFNFFVPINLKATAKAASRFDTIMTPLEFLFRLKKLPPDTQITIAHLGATFEMLLPVLELNPSSASTVPLSKRLTTESGLAEWLGEPIETVEDWRILGLTASHVRYRFGTAFDWIVAHLIPMFSDPVDIDGNSDLELSDISAVWNMKIPAMKVGDQLIGFFRSIAEKYEPSDYELVEISTLSFHPSEMTKQNLANINASLKAHGEFSTVIAESKSKAKVIYDEWKDKAMPEVLLQFFRSALLYDDRFAKEIADELDREIIRKGFNITIWLWQQLIEHDFSSLNEDSLIYAFKLADKYGVNINLLSQVLDSQRQQIFHGTASHLVADTEGDFFHLRPFNDLNIHYERLLSTILNLGLSIDKKNNQGLTARHIANSVEDRHGQGQSAFKNFIEKYESATLLESTLEPKAHAKRSK